MSETTIRIQDNLYEAVNGEWLKTAVIPDDRPTAGGFSDLDQEVEKIMMADFRDFAEGRKTSDIPEMKYAVSLYRKVLDTERRNSEGISPVLPLLERIRSIGSVEDLNREAPGLFLEGVDLPVQMFVDADMQDATKNSFIVMGPSIILPDTAYYAEDNPAGKQLLALYADMAARVLAFTPLSEEEQKAYLKDTLDYDALIAKKVKSRLEWSEYYKCHNPMDTDEAAACVAPFDIRGFLTGLYGENAPSTLIIYDPKAIREMNGYFSEENFPLESDCLPVGRARIPRENLFPGADRRCRRSRVGKAGLSGSLRHVFRTGRRILRQDVFRGRSQKGYRGSGAEDHRHLQAPDG